MRPGYCRFLAWMWFFCSGLSMVFATFSVGQNKIFLGLVGIWTALMARFFWEAQWSDVLTAEVDSATEKTYAQKVDEP